MSDDNKYDYISESQQLEDDIWKLVDSFDPSPRGQSKFVDALESKISQVPNQQQKDAFYIDILKSIGSELSFESSMALYKNIAEKRKLISPLNAILQAREDSEKKQIQGYIEPQLNELSDESLKQTLLLEAGAVLAKNKAPEAHVLLSKLRADLLSKLDEAWALDLSIELAALYDELDDCKKSVSILDSLQVQVLKLEDNTRQLIVASKISELYVSNQQSAKALSLSKRVLSPELDLSLRRLSQRSVKENKDYDSAAQFIELIKSPVQALLGLETWVSQALRDNNAERTQQALAQIKELAPKISDVPDKFNAYIILTTAYLELENEKAAEQYLEQAQALVKRFPEHMQADAEMRVRILKN